MSSRCPGCPVPPGFACHALVAGLAHWCLLREHDPDLAAYIVANSRPGDEQAPPLVPLADNLARHKLVRECRVRGKPACGCDGIALCHRGGLPIERSLGQCLACAAASLS